MIINKEDIRFNSTDPLYLQVADKIIEQIEKGILRRNDILPSVNVLQRHLGISRVTIVNSYNYLRKRGILESRHGKGFFVARENDLKAKKLFLLFDAMNSYKEILYRSFISGLGEGYVVDIFFHYYNLKQFKRFIDNNHGDYNHYVVLPHFNEDVSDILLSIPESQLLLMDKDVPEMKDYAGIFQDFKNDVVSAMTGAYQLLKKYNRIFLAVGSDFQFIPNGIIDGFKFSCEKFGFDHALIKEIDTRQVKPGDAYLVFTDNDLITLVEFAQRNHLIPGNEIGLISYDDTPLKSVLADGITTISTDFRYMGQMAAKMIREHIMGKFKNPSTIIIRNSL